MVFINVNIIFRPGRETGDGKRTTLPSISVTIHKSRASHKTTPLRRERTFDSPTILRDEGRANLHAQQASSKPEVGPELRIPSISSQKVVSGKVSASQPVSMASKLFHPESETLQPSRTDTDRRTPGQSDRVTVIPTGYDDRASVLTGLSAFSSGTTPTMTTHDLDAEDNITASLTVERINLNDLTLQSDADTALPSIAQLNEQLSARLYPGSNFINKTDGLGDPMISEPLVRPPAALDVTRPSRPGAGRIRDRLVRPTIPSNANSARTDRPGSGNENFFFFF